MDAPQDPPQKKCFVFLYVGFTVYAVKPIQQENLCIVGDCLTDREYTP